MKHDGFGDGNPDRRAVEIDRQRTGMTDEFTERTERIVIVVVILLVAGL